MHAALNRHNGLVSADLVAEIYDAALQSDGPSRLAGIMARVADAGSAVIYPFDQRISESGTYGLPAAALEQYASYYHWVNPWFYRALELGVGPELGRAEEIVPELQFKQTEFFADFAKPFDTVEAIGGSIVLGSTQSYAVGVHRGLRSKRFEASSVARLRRLMPHFRGALRLRARLGPASSYQVGLDVLNSMSMGAVVCDRTARTLYANRAAQTAAEAGLGLVLTHRVGALHSDESRRLSLLIADVAMGKPSGGMTVHGRGGARLLILVTPFPLRDLSEAGHVLVTFRSPSEKIALSPAILQQLFGLTVAEACLALSLVNGDSLAKIMSQRGVSENTIRTQLGQVMRKTDTCNQRELIGLLGLLRR